MKNIIVVDYGMGNIKSVQRGLEKVGASVTLSSDPVKIKNAGRLILPGVGSFEDGIKGLKDAGLIGAISDFVKTGNPLLGICLGMQMLLDQSEEHGIHKGLGLIPGNVIKIPECGKGEFSRKIPHIGWTKIYTPNYQTWQGSCLEGVDIGEYFYFVHSFMAVPKKEKYVLAQCEDEGLLVTAAINKDNVIGLQFHPEKSGKVGLGILDKFMSI